MKPCHAAALALVGWYLILPRVLPNGATDIKAPLSEWEQSGVFDHAADCNQAMLELGYRSLQQTAKVSGSN